MTDNLKPGDRVEVIKVNATHFGRVGTVENVRESGKHRITIVFDDGEPGWYNPNSLRLIETLQQNPCHEWETIWDDGERSCCVCTICGEEKIFEHDPEEKP